VLRRKRRLRAGTVQLLGAAAAVALAFVAPQVHIGFDIPTTRAIEMLIAVGGAAVTFIGIVFSLLFLVVQFASTTFTPRLNLFRDDPIVWRSFAFYTAVVVYSLTAALVIGRDEKTSAVVPIIAFVAVLAVIIVYRRLQTGAFKSIQLASSLAQIARRGREVIDGLYVLKAPATDDTAGAGPAIPASSVEDALREILWSRPAAVVQVIDVPRVLRAAARAEAVVEFKVGSGEMITEGATVAVVRGQTDAQLERGVLTALTVGDCWPTSGCGPCHLRSTTPRRLCRRSTQWTVCCACSQPGISASSRSRAATAPSESNLCFRLGRTTSRSPSMRSSPSRRFRRTSRAGSYGCSTISR
jgi:hypothetical protein